MTPKPAAAASAPGRLVYVLTLFSAIGGFLFGYDTGVVSGAMLLVRDDLQLDDFWHELIVSATIGAAGVFALVGGVLADRVGRKPVILSASVAFVVGAVIMAAAGSKEVLLVGRLVVGVGIGLTSMSVPIYISEAAPASVRGRLTTVNNAFITGGQMVASVICGALAGVPQGWRYMLGLAAAPALLQTLGFIPMPESPRHLVASGRRDQALAVLLRLRNDAAAAEEEINDIEQDFETEKAERARQQELTGSSSNALVQVLCSPVMRRALVVGCCLQIFQQFAGINTVMYYSASIITLAGVRDATLAIWLAAALAGVNFVCTFVSFALVERVGRRPLTLASMLGSAISLLVLAISFHIGYIDSAAVTSPGVNSPSCSYSTCDTCIGSRECGFCFLDATTGPRNSSCVPIVSKYDTSAASGRCNNASSLHEDGLTWAPDWCPSDLSWLPVLGLSLYLLCFASGMGPMPWTINAEIYPLWARGACNSVATACNWFSNLLVSLTFLTLTDVLTKHGTFYLYTGLTLIGFATFYVTVPETRGVPLERMGELFSLPWGLHAPRREYVATEDGKDQTTARVFENKAYDGEVS